MLEVYDTDTYGWMDRSRGSSPCRVPSTQEKEDDKRKADEYRERMKKYEEDLKVTYNLCCVCQKTKPNNKYKNCYDCNSFEFLNKHTICGLCKIKYYDKEKNTCCWECYQKEQIVCECGSTVLKRNLNKHEQTKKHCDWRQNNPRKVV